MSKLLKFLDEHIEDYILVILMSTMTIVIFVQVIARYVLGNSLSWSEESARYMFVWLTYLSIPFAARQRKHVKIEAALYMFPKKVRPVIIIIGDIISFLFALFIVYTGWTMTQKQIMLKQTSPAILLPMWIIYIAPCIGFLLFSIRQVQTIFLRIKNLKNGVEMND